MMDNTTIPVLIFWDLFALFMLGVGFYLLRTPPKNILAWDQRTGRWLYERELAASGNEERAIAKAGKFYWWFAAVAMTIASIHIVVVSVLLVVKVVRLI